MLVTRYCSMRKVALRASVLAAIQPLTTQSASESDRLEKLERAVDQLQKRNAELEAEVRSLKKETDGSLIERQLSSRAGVKRGSRRRSTKSRVANLTPLRFRWNFSHNDPWLVAGGVLKRNVKVAVCFDSHSDNAASESEPLVFNSGAL